VLVGGPKRTTRGRRYPFLLERRCGVLVCEGVLKQPNDMHVGDLMCTLHISYLHPLLYLYSVDIGQAWPGFASAPSHMIHTNYRLLELCLRLLEIT